MKLWTEQKSRNWSLAFVTAGMLVYFLLAHPVMMDDGFHYQGFAEALSRGTLDFRNFYGFQGLSFFAVPIFWLTQSHIAIIITSIIFSLLSIPLSYKVGQEIFRSHKAGIIALCIYLLMPYPYVTMMRGFQESALLFFILLIIYGAFTQKKWTGLAWGVGGIVKPFALVLFPLFVRKGMKRIEIWCLFFGICIIALYGIANYAQTGHFVTLAATGAYSGAFDTNEIPALTKSFAIDWKTWARVPANLFMASRKIMVAPLLVLLGLYSLWKIKEIRLRKNIIIAIILNTLMVGAITYAFPKYILPMAVLLALMAIPLLLKYHWMMWLVILSP